MKHYYLDLTLNGIEHREYSMFSLSEGARLFHTIIDNRQLPTPNAFGV